MKRNFVLVIVVLSILMLGTVVSAQGDQITIRWWDWADSIKSWTDATFNNYEEDNPDVNIEYDVYNIGRFNEVLPLAVRSGDAPDVHGVFAYQPYLAVQNNWFQPLDPYINELYPGGVEAWKARFTESSFVEGLNMFDGKIYNFPRQKVIGASGALLFYNKDLFVEAGLDPEDPPETWSEFREYSRKITETGKGKYYGLIMGGKQLNRWRGVVGSLAKTAGKVGYTTPSTLTGFDYQTGKYNYEADNVVKALELLKNIQKDGSFFPGFLSINAPNARARFGNGEAGFIIQGKWCLSTWKESNPDLNVGIAFLPVPDEGRGGYIARGPDASQFWEWTLSSQSENPKEAVKLMLYRMSDANQLIFNRVGDGISPITKVNKDEYIQPVYQKINQLTQENTKIIPMPQTKNANAGIVLGKMKTPSPSFSEILQGAFIGMLDYEKEANKLSMKMNQGLNKAIKEAQDEGVDITREDFIFSDWNPLEDYNSSN